LKALSVTFKLVNRGRVGDWTEPAGQSSKNGDIVVALSLKELSDAAGICRTHLRSTPLFSWPLLNARVGTDVWVKHENHSPIGSIHVRGPLVYLDMLSREGHRPKAVFCASAGDVGLGVAYAAGLMQIPASIALLRNAPPEVVEGIRSLGAEVVQEFETLESANEFAGNMASATGAHHIPLRHDYFERGLATCALEMFDACLNLDAVYIPVGRGNTIRGFIRAKQALNRSVSLFAVIPRIRGAAWQLKAGSGELPDLDTVANDLADIVTVDEPAILCAMRALFQDTHNLADAAGSVALAGLLQSKSVNTYSSVGVVLSGCNADKRVFSEALRLKGNRESVFTCS
jgi:threonine dehydratase